MKMYISKRNILLVISAPYQPLQGTKRMFYVQAFNPNNIWVKYSLIELEGKGGLQAMPLFCPTLSHSEIHG